MPPLTDKPIYQPLVLPNEAIANGGVDILCATPAKPARRRSAGRTKARRR